MLPKRGPRPRGGRPPVPDRACLQGIVFVLRSGIPWEMLPKEMGCGSGMTCWRRLRDWQEAGVWQRLQEELLNELAQQGQLDWNRASMDSATIRAKKKGEHTGPSPVDRGRAGSKRHLVVDGHGTPLALCLTAANVNDDRMLEPLLDAIPPVRHGRGRPRRRPHKLHADKGYDLHRCRNACRQRGIQPRIARRGIDSSHHLGRWRWRVERTLAWFDKFRRLVIRWERRADIHRAFLLLASGLICLRQLQRFC